jgi:hypothetical protein
VTVATPGPERRLWPPNCPDAQSLNTLKRLDQPNRTVMSGAEQLRWCGPRSRVLGAAALGGESVDSGKPGLVSIQIDDVAVQGPSGSYDRPACRRERPATLLYVWVARGRNSRLFAFKPIMGRRKLVTGQVFRTAELGESNHR